MQTDHERYMHEALTEAERAFTRGDRPIGAVIVHQDKIIARGSNAFSTEKSNIEHAEMRALRACAGFLQKNGRECVIYTTVEPCIMCLGAIVMCEIRSIVFGMHDNWIKSGLAIENLPHLATSIDLYEGGVLEEECAQLYRRFSHKEYEMMVTGLKERHP
ncbi:nucleoside deaminase [candidate division WOR-3 bacterium]|nr:nucleoside deaminase [candidate division WOR-3 bacterium]